MPYLVEALNDPDRAADKLQTLDIEVATDTPEAFARHRRRPTTSGGAGHPIDRLHARRIACAMFE